MDRCRGADERPRAIGDQRKSTKQRGYRPVKNQKPKPPSPENNLMFRRAAVETGRAMRNFHHHVLRKRRRFSGWDSENAVVCRIQFDATKKYELLHTDELYFCELYFCSRQITVVNGNLETQAILKQNDATRGAVLLAIGTKTIERQCLRA